ncbi:MAG: tetratricopeptide repeat protein, partial [Clostridia bacterium]|nr:tetratricopeptide repeat protein [Clostridia bacterium]
TAEPTATPTPAPTPTVDPAAVAYDQAVNLADSGAYADAWAAFVNLGDYKDAADRAAEARYHQAVNLQTSGNYADASAMFEQLGEYEDAPQRAADCRYAQAVGLMNAGRYADALAVFDLLTGDEAVQKANECRYLQACNLENSGSYSAALTLFEQIPQTDDIAEHINICRYGIAGDLFAAGDYSRARDAYRSLIPYVQSENMVKECTYRMAVDEMNNGSATRAYELFEELGDYGDSALMRDTVVTPTPVPPAPTPVPVPEIISIEKTEDEQVLVTWKDSGAGPFKVEYAFGTNARGENAPGGVRFTADTTMDCSAVLVAVPGQYLCVYVTDANGTESRRVYNPGEAPAFADGKWTDIDVFVMPVKQSLTSFKLSKDDVFDSKYFGTGRYNYGLDVAMSYPRLNRPRTFRCLETVTAPDGSMTWLGKPEGRRIAVNSGSTGRKFAFIRLGDYFAQLEKHYGSVPQGEYTYTMYLDGMLAGSATFRIQ